MKDAGKMLTSLAGAALMIVVVVLASFWAYGQIVSSARARTHTNELLNQAGELLTALVDAETAQRGYLLANDPTYLEPYLAVQATIPSLLANLMDGTQDPGARIHLVRMETLAASKMTAVKAIIDHYRVHGDLKKLVLAAGPNPKAVMDEFRAEEAGYRAVEAGNLARIDQDFQSSMGFLLVGIVVLCLLMLAFALLVAYFVRRENLERLKSFALQETQHLLDAQESANLVLTAANASLQASEEKLSVTLSSIGDAVLTTDARGLVTLLNASAQELTGWGNDEALGQPVNAVVTIINQETRLPAVVPVLETLEKGTTTGLANHTVMISRSGSERAIADSCSPIRNRQGGVEGAVLVFRDVTEEYAVQQVVKDGAALVQSILNTVADGILTVHGSDGSIETVNPAGVKMLGYPEAELVGSNVSRLIPELIPQNMAGNPWDDGLAWEVTGWRKDGTSFPVDLMVSEMWIGGVRHLTCLFRDISVRRENELALLKSHDELRVLTDELERAARAKSDFLANMSHELRTPLNSINGFSEVLFDQTFGPLNEKQTKYVSNVLTSGEHLLLLINQILDMSKVEAGKMLLKLTVLPLRSVLVEITELIADLARKKKLDMKLEIAEDLPDIEADELKVREILYNLLSNVVKFTPSGGRAGLRARRLGPLVEVEVWDTGIGIAPENLKKVFEGFFRVESSYSQVTEGTGLGLPLSKKLVELHGGTLVVESEGLNKGTVIRFTLPVEAA